MALNFFLTSYVLRLLYFSILLISVVGKGSGRGHRRGGGGEDERVNATLVVRVRGV